MNSKLPVILALAGAEAEKSAMALALTLASEFDSPLQALLLEDPRLYAAAELPCVQELELATASLRPLRPDQLEARAMGVLQRIEQQLGQQASVAGIPWQLKRQRQTDWFGLLPPDASGQFLVWHQGGLWLHPARMPPPTLLSGWLGDPAGLGPLQAASRLARRLGWPLKIHLPQEIAPPSPVQLESAASTTPVVFQQTPHREPTAFIAHLANQPGRALLLSTSILAIAPKELKHSLRSFDGILILVS